MEEGKEKVSRVIEGMDGLLKSVSIYDDAIKPYALAIGMAGEAVLAALAPLRYRIPASLGGPGSKRSTMSL